LTWNGVSLAARATAANGPGTRVAAIFALHNPTSGNQTLNISGTNSARDNMVNCVSFSNVKQNASEALNFPNPITDASGTVATLGVTSASGHIAVGSFMNTTTFSGLLGTTIYVDNSSGLLIAGGGDYVASVSGTTTVGSGTNATAIAGIDVSN
jgi:hypothetical protein